jgi:hypothetical protein
MFFVCISRFLSKQSSALRRQQRVEMLTRFFLAFSEQVLVTGRAILIAALSNRCPKSTEFQAVSDINPGLHPEQVVWLHFWHPKTAIVIWLTDTKTTGDERKMGLSQTVAMTLLTLSTLAASEIYNVRAKVLFAVT